ncbi:MAG: sulfatase-like hydrolase/transferase [Alphaproteobacteria bacterium]|nr:sulfatase-like hydrolase/transferase [Alphaproteobacteria bacterium]
MKKIKHWVISHRPHLTWSWRTGMLALCYWLFFFFAFLALWLHLEFTDNPFENLAFDFQFPSSEFAGEGDAFYLHEFDLRVLYPSFGWTAVVMGIEALVFIFCQQYCIPLEIKHPVIRGIFSARALLLMIVAFLALSGSVRMHEFIYHRVGPDYFSSHYVEPKAVKVTAPAKLKNLLYIYLESTEMAHTDPALFGENLLADMTNMEKNHAGIYSTSFPRFHLLLAAWSTTHGMTASQCGVPVKVIFTLKDYNARQLLPHATCLGDILKANGYYNVQLGGDREKFAGKNRLFLSHSFDEMLGYHFFLARQVPHKYMSPINYYDEVPFHYARQKLDQLQASGKPFYLNLNSYDSHPPTYQGPECRAWGFTDKKGTMKCMARQVRDLILYMQAKGYLKNTVVVIQGDHLLWNNRRYTGPFAKMNRDNRFVFNMFVSDQPLPPRTRDYIVHFDMLPLTLQLMGFTIDGGRLGLGYGGFTFHGDSANYDEKEIKRMDRDVVNPSPVYFNLW